MASITLKNVNKRWGSFVGVKDFNLEIADKEFLVLLGPSGCGKTTTMRMIAISISTIKRSTSLTQKIAMWRWCFSRTVCIPI